MKRSTKARLLLLVSVLSLLVPAVPTLAGPDDDRSYRAGIGLLNKGLSDLAAKEFRTYLDEHPDGAEATNARYSLAVCLIRLGKNSDAAKELALITSVKDFEFAPDAILLQAQCNVVTGDDEAVVRLLEILPTQYPKFAQLDRAATMLGESYYRLGRLKEAGSILVQVSQQWPKSPVADRAELFAAMAEFAVGEVNAAADRASRLRAKSPQGEYAANAALIEAQCRQQLKDLPNASKLFELASHADGSVRIEALLGLASVSRAQNDLPRAEQALADAAKGPLDDDARARLSLEKGKLLYQKGDMSAALAAFTDARKSASDTTKAESAYWFAKCQIKQGKFQEAASNLERSAELFPKSDLLPDILFEHAATLSKAGDDQGAMDAWEDWRTRFAANDLAPEAALAQAWCAHRLGKLEQCTKLCTSIAASRSAPTSSESFDLLLAENTFAQQQFDPALAAYTTFLERHPKSPHAWRAGMRRVLCLTSLERADEASAALQARPAAGDQDPALRRAAVTAVANLYFEQGNWAKGEPWFAALAKESGSPEDRLDALLRQGICIERQSRFADALPVLDQTAKDGTGSPQSLQALFERGQCLLELAKLRDAKAAFEQVAESKDPSLTPHAFRHLATIASKQGRHDDAAAILASLTDAPTPGASKLELGSAYLAAGKYALAEAALTDFLKSDSKADTAPKAAALRAIAINRQGRHEDAIEAFQALGDPTTLDIATRASAQYELAVALRDAGREADAAAAFRTVLKGPEPRFASYASLDLAQIESKAKHYDQCLDLLDRCLAGAEKLDKPDADAITERATYLRAACLLQMNRPKDSADALKDFGKTYPHSQLLASAQLVRGQALLASGQAKDAADQLTLAAAADQPADAQQTTLLRLGEAWAACQDWPKSEQAFTRFLDRFSDSALWFQAKFGQGWARENQGRQDPAIEAYRDVVARHTGPTAARAQFQIGECLYAQGKHELAVAELLKTDVLFAYPEWSAAALYEAGRCLNEMNRAADADKQFADLINRFPDTRWAKLAAEKREASIPAPIPGQAPGQDAPAPRKGLP